MKKIVDFFKDNIITIGVVLTIVLFVCYNDHKTRKRNEMISLGYSIVYSGVDSTWDSLDEIIEHINNFQEGCDDDEVIDFMDEIKMYLMEIEEEELRDLISNYEEWHEQFESGRDYENDDPDPDYIRTW